MKKRLVAIIGVTTLTLMLGTTAFARGMAFNTNSQIGGYCGNGYSFMRDADGNILSQEDFEKNLDKAIEDGTIAKEDRDAYLEMYEYCKDNGGLRRGGCGGRGRMNFGTTAR